MSSTMSDSEKALRLRAEAVLKSKEDASTDILSYEEKRHYHELQVHKIELEMQKDALREANERLTEHQTHLINIIRMSPAGYFQIDLQGRILQVNDAWLRMHGYDSADEVVGKHFSIMQVDCDSESALKHMAELQGGMAIPSGEFISRRKDGSIGHHTFSAHPVVRLNEIVGFEWFIIDISERISAEEEVKKKNAEIEQFIYTASHDLRSPLVTINSFLGYLMEDVASNEQANVSKDLAFIKGATEKMEMLLDELLAMSRIDRLVAPSVNVLLRRVLDEALAVLAGSIRDQNASILLPPSDLMLFGDRQRLCEIWQNLIENALKYSRKDLIPQIELGYQQSGKETVFFVKDNGIGIEPQFLKKIFGIFEKLDAKSPGPGMGLSMVKKIIENCGGKIWVESEGIGKGSCFLFTLPKVAINS